MSVALGVAALYADLFLFAQEMAELHQAQPMAICLIDMLIASLYNYDIYIEPFNEYTNYMLTEIWIRPTISYGLVACFVTEKQ